MYKRQTENEFEVALAKKLEVEATRAKEVKDALAKKEVEVAQRIEHDSSIKKGAKEFSLFFQKEYEGIKI